MNVNEIVKIEQLPKIVQQLELISNEIDKEVEYALSLECNEDSKNEVKQERTKINKIKTDLEDRRKQVKKAVLEPYEEFEKIYNDLVKDKLNVADNTLKSRIEEIEIKQKQEKEQELREFVEQHCLANNIHIDFERIGLNITLSASVKSLKEQALIFIENVVKDLKLIELEEYKNEILHEYQKTLDFANSKMIVIERHKALEELEKRNQEKEQEKVQEEQIIEKVNETITAPVEMVEGEEILTVQFTITDTRDKIKKVKAFLIENGIEYE